MRVLLSTIGTRGDVQPLVALGLQLKALGQEVRLCVPPDFRNWIEGLGIPVTPHGPELRLTGKMNQSPTAEEGRRIMEGVVAKQFETIAAAAQGCNAIVEGAALQIAAPSVAERMGIPYVFAAYCPVVLPSQHHAPPGLATLGHAPVPHDYRELWAKDARWWNETWSAVLNSHRASLGLAPVSDVRSYVLTSRPWLAADPTLGPWPVPADEGVLQTGAWILPDERPLSSELERFLDAGKPPVYYDFGSTRDVPEDLSRVMITSARALERRAILSRGWAGLSLVDDKPDCLAIGEVNQHALFKRIAVIVHHGGAGTTTAAARAGTPQVVLPLHYDQYYWAQRVDHLGIGAAHERDTLTVETLLHTLERALQPDVAARARSLATVVRTDGARTAAQCLTVGRGS
jgi:vancomycin aglycone glucosyltransferase